MFFGIKVKPNSKISIITKVNHPDYDYKVNVISPPDKNKANMEIIKLISEYFNISKNSVKICKGKKSKIKLIEIIEDD